MYAVGEDFFIGIRLDITFTETVDGSPATFIASMMYKTIAELHPEALLPVVCGMQHQFRQPQRFRQHRTTRG